MIKCSTLLHDKSDYALVMQYTCLGKREVAHGNWLTPAGLKNLLVNKKKKKKTCLPKGPDISAVKSINKKMHTGQDTRQSGEEDIHGSRP